MNWQYNKNKNRIILETPPKRTKKITGHRFSSVLGLNQYQTPFGAWCEITGLVKLPFETNKYIEFGKVNEPKMINFAREKFPNVMSCEEYYGANWKDYQYSNYKDLDRIFDGVRDFVCTKNDGKTITLVGECKGASNSAKWADGQVPIDYFCQNALYTYLDNLDKMLFVATFPSAMDYNHPENYIVDSSNTILTVKRLSDFYVPIPHEDPDNSDEFRGDWTTCDVRMGGIEECVEYCEKWWKEYVETGISPEFDEKLDKEYLDIIRKSAPAKDNDLTTLCVEAITLAKEIKDLEVSSGLKNKKDELKVLETAIKDTMIEKEIEICDKYTLKRSVKIELDKDLLAKKYEKVYNECCVEKESYTLSKNLKEEE